MIEGTNVGNLGVRNQNYVMCETFRRSTVQSKRRTPPPRHTAPPSWEGKVAEIKELSRRATIKKRKLKEAVQVLVDEGGHHVMDEEGMAGLEVRGVDDGLVDEMVGAGLVDPDQMSDED
jgi:hypothetical protein